MISAESVTLSFGATVALAGASATARRGEVVALVGPSGSGKSTMLYCMAGLLRPASGRVFFNGTEISSLSDARRSALRRREFGFVFQFAELVPELTLRENVELPLDLNRVGNRKARRARVDELLQRLDIVDAADRRPVAVSGGQVQRAAVARAVAHRPAVIFADEPTGAVDSENGKVVMEILLELAGQDGAAVVMVTHDPHIAAGAHRTVPIRDGVTDELR